MQTEIIFAGFGGQGVLFSGMLMTYAGMDSGKNATWLPSYGPEMRGGTAHVTVIISDEEIGSPLVENPGAALVFNIPSMKKYETKIRPGGVLVYNSSLINLPHKRNDITYIPVPASKLAAEMGNPRVANVIALGALTQAIGALPLEAVHHAIKNHLPPKKQPLVPLNQKALKRGAALVTNLAT